MTRYRTVPLALIAAAIAATPAAADQGRRVSYADLDLTSESGIATLDARIDRAVRQICGSASPSDLRGRHYVQRCRTETRASVQARRSDALAQARDRSIQLASRGE
jgi:UrcA family protein